MAASIDQTTFDDALAELGALLQDRGERFELCVIGGAAFVLQRVPGFVATADLDVAAQVRPDGTLVAPAPLPAPLADAIGLVADSMGLGPHWINSAVAASFGVRLPDGFLDRAARIEYGGLILRVASRQDLLALKLLAALRRGQPGDRHRDDLMRAQATDSELSAAAEWVLDQSSDRLAAEPRLREVMSLIADRRDA